MNFNLEEKHVSTHFPHVFDGSTFVQRSLLSYDKIQQSLEIYLGGQLEDD